MPKEAKPKYPIPISHTPFRTEPEDYQKTTMELSFDSENSRHCVAVPIVDDDLVEDGETFFGALSLTTTSASGTTDRIAINPPETAVTIQSDDGKEISPSGTYADWVE